MKRTSLIALGTLGLLTLVFLLIQEKPVTHIEPPLTIEPPKPLARVELERPAQNGESHERIVFEQRDEIWWLVEPLEHPASDKSVSTLEKIFGQTIRTDDLDISSERMADYELTDDKAVKLALFSPGEAQADAQLLVGREIEIAQTRAKRTYIRKPSSPTIYRAQTEMGKFFRQELNEFRNKNIIDVSPQDLESIEIAYHEGITIELQKEGNEWNLTRPEVDFELDRGTISRVSNSLARLRAQDFADDISLQDAGLDAPMARVTLQAKDKTIALAIGNSVEKENQPLYYVKRQDAPFVYLIPERMIEPITSGLIAFRSRDALNITSDDITSLTSVWDNGAKTVELRRQNDAWQLIRPERATVEPQKASSLIQVLAPLRVSRYENRAPTQVESLAHATDSVSIRTAGGDVYKILIGGKVQEDRDDRYAHFASDDLVFVLPGHIIKRLQPDAKDLIEQHDL